MKIPQIICEECWEKADEEQKLVIIHEAISFLETELDLVYAFAKEKEVFHYPPPSMHLR